MPFRFRPRHAVIAAALALTIGASHAASEEIQVYLDDLSAPGQFGVNVHNNFVFKGARTASYPGETPPYHQYRLTPEFYYGITPTLELGLYLLASRTAEGNSRLDGSKLRLKYIAPHDEKGRRLLGLEPGGRQDGGPVAASLDIKVARQVADRTQLGAELYSDLGPARAVQAWKRNAKTLYLVLDQELGREIDLNLGIGRGLTPDADRWTLKFIVGTHF